MASLSVACPHTRSLRRRASIFSDPIGIQHPRICTLSRLLHVMAKDGKTRSKERNKRFLGIGCGCPINYQLHGNEKSNNYFYLHFKNFLWKIKQTHGVREKLLQLSVKMEIEMYHNHNECLGGYHSAHWQSQCRNNLFRLTTLCPWTMHIFCMYAIK